MDIMTRGNDESYKEFPYFDGTRQGPTLRYFVTPADFCMGSLKEAMDLFPDGSKLKLLLSDSDIGTDVEIGIPVEFSSILPPDAWMLISDNVKGDIFYCPGA